MTRPVLYEANLVGIGAAGRLWARLVQDGAQRVHHVQIFLLAIAADVIGLARSTALEDHAEGFAVVEYVEPIAHLLTVAVYRQRLARERVADHERDELLRELERPVI